MKRFYREVTVAPDGESWRVLLDGRAIRTPGGRPQAVPTRALAEAMAEEWAGQGEEIDSGAFALRDLADFAIDVAGPAREQVIAEIVPYAETDTLCYRAEPEEALHRRQWKVWEPVLAAAEARLGVRFERVSGIIHRRQPAATLERLAALLREADPFTLAALRMLASLAASLVIALEALEPDADVDRLWEISELEEEWQADLWGRDDEAESRRAGRRAAFATAKRFAALAGAAE
jgi:chaperone required for assembly of F1-ATPase